MKRDQNERESVDWNGHHGMLDRGRYRTPYLPSYPLILGDVHPLVQFVYYIKETILMTLL